ncbi:MAG: helix-turn-helix transcriptional regulator [Chloroflexi bacterium]|nr:MAG: helix-turn-helix transcriptional regulator [Chloroflexota bacterium]
MKPPTSKGGVKPHGLPHLRVLRQRKGLSLGQLADMTGIRRDTIAHLETGRELSTAPPGPRTRRSTV